MRRQDVEPSPRPLRSIRHRQLLLDARHQRGGGSRVQRGRRRRPSPVIALSYHAWQGAYGGDPSIIGASLIIEGRAFTVAGVTPPGFYGETLRADPPDLWIPIQHEPLINGSSSLLRQPVSAWLRVIGRLRPGATTDGMAARLTGILHQWIQHDSGYPANWMPDHPHAAAAGVVVPAGSGVGT